MSIISVFLVSFIILCHWVDVTRANIKITMKFTQPRTSTNLVSLFYPQYSYMYM